MRNPGLHLAAEPADKVSTQKVVLVPPSPVRERVGRGAVG